MSSTKPGNLLRI